MGNGKFLCRSEEENSFTPKLIEIPSLESRGVRIKFMYSSYNKCAVVDTSNAIYIWGHNFQGF